MGKIKTFIGIDISSKWLDIAIIRSQKTEEVLRIKFDNTLAALRAWKSQLKIQRVFLNKSTLVIFESTGVYTDSLLRFLTNESCLVCNESALRIKNSMGIQRGKSDVIDAHRIAQYGYYHSDNLTFWTAPRKQIIQLRQLLANRERILKYSNALKIPLKTNSFFQRKKDSTFIQKLNNNAINGLDESFGQINESIDDLVESDSNLKSQFKLITSVPCVGRITALYLIVYTDEFKRFKEGKKLACYAGVAPFENTSGSSTMGKSRVHRIANQTLKRVLHTGALAAVSHSGDLKNYYQRKVASGKSKLQVINAVRNKLVLRVMAVINRGTPYQKEWISPNYHLNYADIVQAS
jgi:transposase